MLFLVKMTKMPPVNLGLTEGQTRSKSSQNNIFMVLYQTQAPRRFLASLTKCDSELTPSELTPSEPRNPYFDPAVKTG